MGEVREERKEKGRGEKGEREKRRKKRKRKERKGKERKGKGNGKERNGKEINKIKTKQSQIILTCSFTLTDYHSEKALAEQAFVKLPKVPLEFPKHSKGKENKQHKSMDENNLLQPPERTSKMKMKPSSKPPIDASRKVLSSLKSEATSISDSFQSNTSDQSSSITFSSLSKKARSISMKPSQQKKHKLSQPSLRNSILTDDISTPDFSVSLSVTEPSFSILSGKQGNDNMAIQKKKYSVSQNKQKRT